MMKWLNTKTGKDLIEHIVSFKTFSILAVTIILAAFFLASDFGTTHDESKSVGSVDLSDIANNNKNLPIGEVIAEAPVPDNGLFYISYRVTKGDTLSAIAAQFGVTIDAIVTLNSIKNARILSIGKYLKIPTCNGILYEVKKADSIDSIAKAYNISGDRIKEINKIDDTGLKSGKNIFLPDARLASWELREISGELFSWPVRGYITSWYGWRNDPLTGSRSFHSGLDIGAARGTPVYAAMEGTVIATGYSTISGKYVLIRHHSGYTTLYAHLDRIDVSAGKVVNKKVVIGAVGSTGYSTGAHLHFTVSKNGYTVNPMTLLH